MLPLVINLARRKSLLMTRPMIMTSLRLEKVWKGIMHLELNAAHKIF